MKSQDVIQRKEELSKKKADLKKSQEEQEKIQTQIDDLKAEKEKSQAAGEDVSELDNRIESAEEKLAAEKAKQAKIEAVVKSLQDALNKLDEGLGKMTEKHEAKATSLRDMQMQMLDKVEEYEKARREQAAELIKVKALLKGKRTQEETIQLAIRSLNLSISALKRAKEIIEEISFFFKSFADYMKKIQEEANFQNEQNEFFIDVMDGETLEDDDPVLVEFIESTDAFFINQKAEWIAVSIVSQTFVENFNEGWSKLNKLSGKYITGDKLGAYLEEAAVQLQEIADEREATANKNIAMLDNYRKQISEAQSS